MATLNEALVEFIYTSKNFLIIIGICIGFYYVSRAYHQIMQVHKKEVHIHNTFRYDNCTIEKKDDQ